MTLLAIYALGALWWQVGLLLSIPMLDNKTGSKWPSMMVSYSLLSIVWPVLIFMALSVMGENNSHSWNQWAERAMWAGWWPLALPIKSAIDLNERIQNKAMLKTTTGQLALEASRTLESNGGVQLPNMDLRGERWSIGSVKLTERETDLVRKGREAGKAKAKQIETMTDEERRQANALKELECLKQ